MGTTNKDIVTDEQIVENTLHNPDAYGEIIDRYEQKLHRYIHRLTGLEDETIDEVLQMVFIKAYRNLAGFNTSLRFSSWIYRIAHNESIDACRKNKYQPISLDSSDEDTQTLLDVLASDVDIVSEVGSLQHQEALHQIFSELSDKYREVLVLHYLEGKSYEEISDILKKPMGTVATLISRAKQQFQNLATSEQYQCLFA